MNKEQKKILIYKILPKFLILAFMIGGGIYYLISINQYKENVKYVQEFDENGGSQATQIAIGKYDSLIVDKLTIKYPKDYKITDKFGNLETGGSYTLMSSFPKDELTFSYTLKELIEGLPSSITSVDDDIKNLEVELVANLTKMTNKKPILEDIKTEKIGEFNVHIRKIKYNNNSLYIYGLESEKYYFTFTSHLNYFLNAIVQNLKDKK
ncbi:hypothetical protein LVDJXP189_2190003 [Flavobacterium psychrophilum]|uniref:hypothetical protein n=1 Tax=Flavobacterium psychrophilum TaxID=96345 RepID=UPI000B7C11D3|nr:hypothetical protein [Flavobacterium psychrophilum]SNB43030.1 hypothetical protein LVDJXP189_2190003 [Flavobacterium psychrophilum]